MSLTTIRKGVQKSLRSNSPAILTGLGVSGTISTAYLASKAAFKIGGYQGIFHEKPLKEKIKICWKEFIPAAGSGAVTIACIIGATRVSTQRTAAAISLLSVSQRAFEEYSEKVVEQLGEKKEKVIRDEIAQDKMNANPVSQGVIVFGRGNVLCYEEHTGRYFESDMETLRKAQNDINEQMLSENEANLNDFYHLINLPYTSSSSQSGWNSDKLMKLEFSTVLSDDGRPCLSMRYNYIVPF